MKEKNWKLWMKTIYENTRIAPNRIVRSLIEILFHYTVYICDWTWTSNSWEVDISKDIVVIFSNSCESQSSCRFRINSNPTLWRTSNNVVGSDSKTDWCEIRIKHDIKSITHFHLNAWLFCILLPIIDGKFL